MGLLGCHVRRGAEDHPLQRHRRRGDGRRVHGVAAEGAIRAANFEGLGQAEVQHLDRAVVADLDVGGFEIARDHPLVVCGVERLDDLFRDDERARGAVVFETMELRDVRVIQRGERPRLALEAGQPIRVPGKDVRQDLERNLAGEPRVPRAVDLAHAARPSGEHFVRTDAGACKQRHGWRHYRRVPERSHHLCCPRDEVHPSDCADWQRPFSMCPIIVALTDAGVWSGLPARCRARYLDRVGVEHRTLHRGSGERLAGGLRAGAGRADTGEQSIVDRGVPKPGQRGDHSRDAGGCTLPGERSRKRTADLRVRCTVQHVG